MTMVTHNFKGNGMGFGLSAGFTWFLKIPAETECACVSTNAREAVFNIPAVVFWPSDWKVMVRSPPEIEIPLKPYCSADNHPKSFSISSFRIRSQKYYYYISSVNNLPDIQTHIGIYPRKNSPWKNTTLAESRKCPQHQFLTSLTTSPPPIPCIIIVQPI